MQFSKGVQRHSKDVNKVSITHPYVFCPTYKGQDSIEIQMEQSQCSNFLHDAISFVLIFHMYNATSFPPYPETEH